MVQLKEPRNQAINRGIDSSHTEAYAQNKNNLLSNDEAETLVCPRTHAFLCPRSDASDRIAQYQKAVQYSIRPYHYNPF